MKNIRMVAALLVLGLMLMVPGPARSQENKADAKQHKEYQGVLEKRLQQLGKDMDELVASGDKKAAEVREQLKREAEEFRRTHKDAERKLREMGKSADETWDKAKAGAEKALEELKRIYERARTSDENEGR